MSDNLTFEDLPNEIFQDIFEYFDLYELYKTFSRLNSRIESIIKNCQCFQITLHTPDDINHPAYRYFSLKIQTVIVQHSKYFCDSTKFIPSQIRCLILCRPTREQWNSIIPHIFPNLERLYLINSVFIYRTEELCRLIFSNQFPSLHTCSLPHISYEDNNQWTCSPHLQSLKIKIWNIRIYTQILNTCPKLNRLKIELTGGDLHETLPLCDSNQTHSNLRYLSIYPFSPITCEFIDAILSFIPNLKQFLINTNPYISSSYIPIDTLASILELRTPKLNRININIPVSNNLDCQHTKYILFKSCEIHYELNHLKILIITGSL